MSDDQSQSETTTTDDAEQKVDANTTVMGMLEQIFTIAGKTDNKQ